MNQMTWVNLLSRKRSGVSQIEQKEVGRSHFQNDIDRIIFSSAFRRLNHKTQVHPLPENDNIQTRLPHSLEVSSVGRSLGTKVGTAVCEFMRYSYLQKPHLERGREFKVSPICLRTAVKD